MTEETATAPATATTTEPETTTVPATRQRRKRKWDQPAEGVLSAAGVMPGLLPLAAAGAFGGLGFPYANHFPAMSSVAKQAAAAQSPATVQQNAAAIVQKFNQDLASKGLLLQAKIQDELIAREITINDADPGVRYKLTKRQTQEEIQVKTGAVVITRGRYRPPNGPVEQEKPLYLHISAGVNLKDTTERIKAVDQAAAMVEEMLKQGQQAQVLLRSAPAGNSTNGNVTAPTPMTVNIFVGFEAEPSFNLIGRIRGPNDQYINHIMAETGASVVLRGRGSGNKEGPSGEELPQPLHLSISSDSTKSVEDAKTLAENLLETIRPESFNNRLSPYQVLPITVLAVSPSTYLTPQQAPYQSSLTNTAYGGYYPSVGGGYPLPYALNQAPIPFPPPSTISLSSAQPVSTPANPYSNMLPSTKVYGAVPPPIQFLAGQSLEQTDQSTDRSVEKKSDVRILEKFSQFSTDNCASSSLPSATVPTSNSSISHAGNLIDAFSSPQILPRHKNFASSAHLSASQLSHSSQVELPGQSFSPVYSQAFASSQSQAPATSTYGAYGGAYSEASPVQQVAAQALQRPPLPVSVKPPTSSALLATLTKAQSSSFQEKYSDKQPAQRRKFQEFPVGGKDSSGEEQQERRAPIRSAVDAPGLSQDTSPPGISMPPPASRSMPPPSRTSMPPPKSILSSGPSRPTSLSPSPAAGSKQLDAYVAPPGVGLKLVEYGEEEEESLAGHKLSPQSKPFSNGKPFWAL